VEAEYLLKIGDVVTITLRTAHTHGCNFILIGGYRASPLVEVVKGSFVDAMLRETDLPTLICR
jgi:nucleotide-binding universal stress UspA family protein